MRFGSWRTFEELKRDLANGLYKLSEENLRLTNNSFFKALNKTRTSFIDLIKADKDGNVVFGANADTKTTRASLGLSFDPREEVDSSPTNNTTGSETTASNYTIEDLGSDQTARVVCMISFSGSNAGSIWEFRLRTGTTGVTEKLPYREAGASTGGKNGNATLVGFISGDGGDKNVNVSSTRDAGSGTLTVSKVEWKVEVNKQ